MISNIFSILFGGLVVFCVMGCCSTSKASINCFIVNLEKVNCTWSCISGGNFSYKLASPVYSGCPIYQYQDHCRVGCIFPFYHKNRYRKLHTTLTNGATSTYQTHQLEYYVKLDPPQNLSIQWNSSGGDVLLQWAIGGPVPYSHCVNSMVSYRKGSGKWQDSSVLLYGRFSYALSEVSQTQKYTFKVRSRYGEICGESKLWSDWSAPVSWGPLTPRASTVRNETYFAIGAVFLFIILVIMVCVLLRCERIKVIFVPVVPDPTKKLNELFYEYGGDIEGWVRISPEMRDAFEPDFTESPCTVTETKPTL